MNTSSRNMFGLWLIFLAAMFSTLFAGPAWSGEADAFDMEVQPSTPAAGESFTVSVRAFACHIFLSEGPLDRTVDVTGSTVRVTVDYLSPPFNGSTCMPPTLTWSWSVGPLAPGAYTLVLVGEEPGEAGSTFELEQIPLTIVTPIASIPSVVPANDPWMLLLLGLSLTTCALLSLRNRP